MIKLTNKQKSYIKELKDKIILSDHYIIKYRYYLKLVNYLNNTLGIKEKEYKNNILIDYKLNNTKISGNDTIIFSLGTALNCYCGLKGYCPLYKTKKCYALRNEIQYNTSILFKHRQYKQFKKLKTWQLIRQFIRIKRKYKGIKYLRLNESADIKNQKELNKIILISKGLKKHGIKVYTYSHNKELNINTNYENLCINSSIKNNKNTNRFLSYDKTKINRINAIKKNKRIVNCKMDCSKCKLCTMNNKLTILCKIH